MELFPLTAADFASSRDGALGQLAAFVPRAGRYSRDRNHVLPGHPNVSRLSPAIRHRLITETEAAAAPRQRYAASTVEKFTQEVYWRRYWKSWLSLRPQLWNGVLDELGKIRADPVMAEARERAAVCEAGESGLAVMDHFAKELVDTGYMHNHARMWFAAWWVHVERLPWQLGADFFFRHLLDGDPASNTLSWRWVAGLQTRGKTYLPRRSNIEKYLAPEILAECAAGLEQLERPEAHLPELPPKPDITRRELPAAPLRDGLPTGLWIHEEDLYPESSPLWALAPRAIVVAGHRAAWEQSGFPGQKVRWLERALADTADRATAKVGVPVDCFHPTGLAGGLGAWARQHGLTQVAALRPEVGPLHDELESVVATLGRDGIRLALVDRHEDLVLRPLATGGFFSFWKKVQSRLASQEE